MEQICSSAEQTKEFAKRLAGELKPGSFLALRGDLGAGKTVFAQGIALGLGICEAVVSPTFTVLRVYENEQGLELFHFDLYRIEDMDELYEIGFDEYANGDGICVCEWPERAEEMLPDVRLEISIEKLDDETRRITVREAQ